MARSQRSHGFLGTWSELLGSFMIFCFTVPTCPTALSLFQSPIILFPLTGPPSALPDFSCSHMSPPGMPCISSVHPPSPADRQALVPRCLQAKTKRLCLALQALSEPTSAQPSGVSPPFGTNWIAWVACLMPTPSHSSELCNLFILVGFSPASTMLSRSTMYWSFQE